MAMHALQHARVPRAECFGPCSHRSHCRGIAFTSARPPARKKQAQHGAYVQLSRRTIRLITSAAAATDVGAQAVQAIKKSVGGDVFVAGGNGQLSARIIQELLRNGFKVTAGVSDIEEAQASLEFAKRFELIKGSETKNIRLQEVDLSDESAIAAALPRNARVLVAVGDSFGNQRIDNQLVNRALAAAVESKAQQFILVTPLGGGGGGGLFGSFFSGGTSSKQPSKIERQVADSGLDFVIVRSAKTDGVDPSLAESGVALTPQGTLTGSDRATKTQVAEVVAQVLLQAQTDVLIEVAADPNSTPRDVDAQVAQVLPEASITEEEGGAEEVEEEQEEEPPEPQAPPSKGPGGLFGRTQQLKAQPRQPESDEEEKPRRGGGLGGLFGGRSKSAADAPTGPQKQKKIDAKLQDAKPVGKERGGFRQIRAASRQAKDEDEDEEDNGTFQNPLAGLFGGTRKIKAEAQQKTPSVQGARKAAAQGIAAKGQQGKSAAKRAGRAVAEEPTPQKKGGGFLQALGIGQESTYADDD